MGAGIRWTLAGAGVAAIALTSGLLVAAGGRAVTPAAETAPAPPPSTSDSPDPTTTVETSPPPDPAAVAAAVTDAVTAASHGTSVGLVVYDRRTGHQLAAVNAGKPYYTASVVKLLIAIDEVHDDHTGTWVLPDADTVGDLTDMLSGSNDGIASAFWSENGGTSIVTRTARLIGLTDTVAPTDPGQWGMTKTSPSDVAAVYAFLEDTMPDN